MPIYAFACEHCGHHFDRLQKLSDPDPDTCPECGHVGVRRQLTAPQFRLAGGGWYETDFKGDGDKKRNLADKSGDSAPAPKSESAAAPAAGAAAAPAKAAESQPVVPKASSD